MMKLKWNNGKTLEIRALEISKNGAVFRVDSKRKADFEEKPAFVSCCFLDYKKREYHMLELADFQIAKIQREDTITGALYYELRSENEEFFLWLGKLSKDYMNYIMTKLDYDEQDVLGQLTGSEIKEEYAEGLKKWKNNRTEDCCWNGKLKDCQIAVALDDRRMVQKYLSLDLEEFLEFYWKNNCLSHHQIAKEKVSHVYFGSQYCIHQVPGTEIIKRILIKSQEEGMIPVICFPPMSEGVKEKVQETLLLVNQLVEEEGLHKPIELVVNDIGTALLAKDLIEKSEIEKEVFQLTAGVLLHKKKKDPRAPFAFQGEKLLDAGSSLEAEEYRNYLAKLGIEKYSFEAGCRLEEIKGCKGILHLPLYQTNTASRCTLQSIIEDGSRSVLKYKKECSGYCCDNVFLYPESSNIIGKGNSLFGYCLQELQNLDYLNELINGGIERLVVRF